jgi:hypothetical protein
MHFNDPAVVIYHAQKDLIVETMLITVPRANPNSLLVRLLMVLTLVVVRIQHALVSLHMLMETFKQ